MKKSVKINQKLSKTNQKLRRKDSDSEIIAKREREWNNRFILGRIQDHDFSEIKDITIFQKNSIFTKLYSNRKPNKEKDKNYQNLNPKYPMIDIDNDVQELWNELHVNTKYQESFRNYILYFPKAYHNVLFEKETNSLTKIVNLINNLHNDIKKRKEILIVLKNGVQSYQKGKDIKQNEKILNQIKRNLLYLQSQTIEIFNKVIELKEYFYIGIKNGKYDPNKIYSSPTFVDIFDNELLIKLNSDLDFIRESIVGNLFGIQNNFDPFLFEISGHKEDVLNQQNNSDVYYNFLNEMTASHLDLGINFANYNENINRLKKQHKKGNLKEYIDADCSNNEVYNSNEHSGKKLIQPKSNRNVNYVSKEQLEKTINDQMKMLENTNKQVTAYHKVHLNKNEDTFTNNLREVEDNYIKGIDNENNKVDKLEEEIKLNLTFTFHINNNVDEFIKRYTIEYFPKISSKQKQQLTIEKNIKNSFNTSSFPIMIKATKDKKLYGICLLSTSNENRSLEIKHLSSLSQNDKEYKAYAQDTINFIYNSFNFCNLFININNSKDNDKNSLKNIFESLKFNEIKTIPKGIRMKFVKNVNNETKGKGNNNFMFIQSGLLTIKNNENITKENENNLNMNSFLINIYEYEQNKIDEISSKLNNELKILKDSNDSIKINAMLKQSQFDKNIQYSKNKVTILLYDLFLSHPSFSIIKIKEKNYIRIKTNIQVLKHKETEQIIYQLTFTRSIILGEINKKFLNYLNSEESKGNNLPEKISLMYKLFELDTKKQKLEAIFIPFTFKEDLNKNSVMFAYEKLKIGSDDQFINEIKDKCVQLLPNEHDIVINKKFLFAVNNNDISINNNILCLYCNIFDI